MDRGGQRRAPGACSGDICQAELVQGGPQDCQPSRPIGRFEIPGRAAVLPNMPDAFAAERGRRRECAARKKARTVYRDLDMRDDFFPGPRHSHRVGRLDLVHQRDKVLIGLADMRDHVRNQRSIDCDRPAHTMGERKLADDAMRTRPQLGKSLDEAIPETDNVGALRPVGGFRKARRARRENNRTHVVGLNRFFELDNLRLCGGVRVAPRNDRTECSIRGSS